MTYLRKRTLWCRLDNNRGSILLMSYLVITVLLILGAAFMVVTINESRTSEIQRKATQAFYVAEAGIERALYDLRQDFIVDSTNPGWADGDINGMAIGPNTGAYFNATYSGATLGDGSYAVSFMNISGEDDIWIRSTGTIGGINQTILVYARVNSISPWDNAVFGGSGSLGSMVNGNVGIHGSVHILGTGLSSADYAIDLGGTAGIVLNNYSGMDPGIAAKIPALPTTVINGETVETLNAELRVKHGMVGLSGSSSVGEADVFGNSVKETISGAYVTDGYGGNKGAAGVFSDNGATAAYDLGDTLTFPSLSDPYTDGATSYTTYQDYLRANALVITDPGQLSTLADMTPNSNFSYSGANGSISMDGNGNMTISGIVYMGDDVTPAELKMKQNGPNKTITYSGTGSIFVTGEVEIYTNLVTSGNNSFPTNILGIMTPDEIEFEGANADVMGVFYSEGEAEIEHASSVVGALVANYFDMETNVPSIFHVPSVANNLPPGMISGSIIVDVQIVSWQKIDTP